jgi:NAD(P)-dependent dehydrogenase (short-subunit alcohol dehydrogenase family)
MTLALVTGATGGMGVAICNALADEGFNLLMTARRADSLQALTSQLSARFPRQVFEWHAGDLSNQAFIKEMFDVKLQGRKLGALVNNAGISLGADIEITSLDDWNASIAVNLTAPFLLIQYALPLMKENGGSIINVASLAAVQGAKKPSYAASKAGLIGLTKSAALSAGKYNVRVNAIVPGAVDTDLIRDWSHDKRAAITAQIPLGHIAHPDEIADIVLFLASERSRVITGVTLNATGGAYLGG